MHGSPSDPWTGLAQVSLLYLFVIVGVLLMDFGQSYLMQWTGQNAMFDLRRQIMAHLQRLDIQFFDRNPVGRLVTRVTTDIDVLNELFSSGIVTMLGDLLVISFVIMAMFKLSAGLDADHADRDAVRHSGDSAVPPVCLAQLSPNPRCDRENQRLSAGARERNHGLTPLQS